MVWEAAVDVARSEAGHPSGNRPGLSQEVIYGLESQFINLQGSYLCPPKQSMGAICPRRSLLAGELNAEASNGLEVACGNLRRRKGVGISWQSLFLSRQAVAKQTLHSGIFLHTFPQVAPSGNLTVT